MFTWIFFGIVLLIIVIAALLMPWHAKRGEKKFKRGRDDDNHS